MNEITLFACVNSFEGSRAEHQRLAIESWTRLVPRPEILLFGLNEPGAEEFARERGLPIYPVDRSQEGTPLLGSILEQGEAYASNDILCFVNADIIISQALIPVTRRACEFDAFLLSAQRRDIDLTSGIDFDTDWTTTFADKGRLHPTSGIDLFCYRGYRYGGQEPGFVYARMTWDNWVMWYAQEGGAPFLDGKMLLLHPNHERVPLHTAAAEERHNLRLYKSCMRKPRNAFDYATHILDEDRWLVTEYGRREGW